MSSATFDIMVTGSGPGGAVVASVAAQAGARVLLLEEGAAANCDTFSSRDVLLNYRNGGLTYAFGRPGLQYGEASCVGGGSEVNAGLFHRTPGAILQEWAKTHGLAGAASEDLQPHFEAIERELEVGEGEISAASRLIAEGANQLRWSVAAAQAVFAGRPGRKPVRDVYLPMAAAAGCKLVSGARVEKIAKREKGWVVSTTRGKYSGRTVFLCGGAISTPAILRRSGFRRNIGDTLQFHPTVKVVARFGGDAGGGGCVPVHQIKEFWPRLSLGGSFTSIPLLALELGNRPGAAALLREHGSRMAIFYVSCRPLGRGSVRNVPFFRDPLVRFSFLPEDLLALQEGAGKLGELLFAAGAEEIYPSVGIPVSFRSLANYRGFLASHPAARWKISSVHLFSSCPAGEVDSATAAGSFGNIHGAEGLFVADASMLCSAPGVNPQGTIMAFARRNIFRFLEKGGQP